MDPVDAKRDVEIERLKVEEEKHRLELARFEFEKQEAAKGFGFRTYVVPLSTAAIAFAVALVGYFSYSNQAEMKLVETKFTASKNKLDLYETRRKQLLDASEKLDTYVTAHKAEIEMGSDLPKRIASSERIAIVFRGISPGLVIDFFRYFREAETPPKDVDAKLKEDNDPPTPEQECASSCKCATGVAEYYVRACLMNKVRPLANQNIKIDVIAANPDALARVLGIIENESFAKGTTKIDKTVTAAEVVSYDDDDLTFAETAADRLNEKTVPLAADGPNFRGVSNFDPDLAKRHHVLICVPDKVKFKQ